MTSVSSSQEPVGIFQRPHLRHARRLEHGAAKKLKLNCGERAECPNYWQGQGQGQGQASETYAFFFSGQVARRVIAGRM